MDIERANELLNKLSYTMQKKSYRIMELRIELNNMTKNFIIPGTISATAGCYTAISYKTYANYALTTFSRSNNLFSNVKTMDLVAPFLLISGGVALYFIQIKINRLNKEYEELRNDITKSINSSFCTCGIPCSCKDEYIKIMEKIGIDLVF